MRPGSTTRLTIPLGVLLLAGCAATAPDGKVRPLLANQPIYPASAERQHRAGWAALDCTITAAGTTRDCRVSDASAPDFAASALEFVQHARYAPATHNGVPVEQRHHTFKINYTLPARTITLNVVCTVRASGEVRNCLAPINTPPSAEWQLGRGMLERMTVTPLTRDGKPVDDPGRAITLKTVIAPLPLTEPMPTLSGDVVGNTVLACRRMPAGRQTCSVARSRAETGNTADTTWYQVEVAITGVAPPPTGDFSQ